MFGGTSFQAGLRTLWPGVRIYINRPLVWQKEYFVLDSAAEAIAAIRRGEMVVVLDDEGRENEGDIIMAAEFATAESISFIVRKAAGLLCVAIPEDRADRLDLPLMVAKNTDRERTAFAVSVDAVEGTTTGVSPTERARTAVALADPSSTQFTFNRPGHVNVLRARERGVLQRAGHTEAAVDLSRLAGLQPAGVLCEILSEDGTGMARRPELTRFAKLHGLRATTVADLIRHRRAHESLVKHTSSGRLPTQWGEFTCHAYESQVDGLTHLAMVYGDLASAAAPLVRVHSECLTGDIFSSQRCDCGAQLTGSMKRVVAEGRGVVVYLRGHEGRGIGIASKLRAYQLQDAGADTVDANLALGLPVDSREYGVGAEILVDLGLTRIRLLSNNPRKRGGLEGYGLEIVEQVPLESHPTTENLRYLRTKRDRLGHHLTSLEHPAPPSTGELG